jgi:hypothetical protein
MAKRDGFDTWIKSIYAAVVIVTLASAALAQNATPTPPQTAPRAAIITDEEQGVIHFIIDGREVARLDDRGFHVVGEIQYGGTLTDTGSAYIENYMAGGGDAP